MLKFVIKILLTCLIISLFLFTCSYAADYNIPEDSDISNSENEENTENEATAQSTHNTAVGYNTSTSYNSISSIPEANLGLNNILNILLIAVGVLIILLAIAILIKLHK